MTDSPRSGRSVPRYCRPLLPLGETLTFTRNSKFLSVPPRQVRKRLNLSVPSALPVRQPSSTDQYFGFPSQPVRSRPLKTALNPSDGSADDTSSPGFNSRIRISLQRT